MQLEIFIPVVSAIVTTMGLVWVAKINRESKPMRDVLKRTKLEGNGSLVEALTALSSEYRDSQDRHSTEVGYFVTQLREVREDLAEALVAIKDRDGEIAHLKKQLQSHERRLNQSHTGVGK